MNESITHPKLDAVITDLRAVIETLEYNGDTKNDAKHKLDELAVARIRKAVMPGHIATADYPALDYYDVSGKWGDVAIEIDQFLANITATAPLPLSTGRTLNVPAMELSLYAAELAAEGGRLIEKIEGCKVAIEKICSAKAARFNAAVENLSTLMAGGGAMASLLTAYEQAIESALAKDAAGQYNDFRDCQAIVPAIATYWLMNLRPQGSSGMLPECVSGTTHAEFRAFWLEYQKRQGETIATDPTPEPTPEPEPQPKKRGGRVA